MITYTLPDFTVGLGLNLFFIRLLEQRPSWFQADVRIGSVYGSFPGCIMNGGRAFIRERTDPRQMEESFALLEEHGVVPRLTLTNMVLTQEQFEDEYANAMLAAAARHGGEAIIYADDLGDYVRERYDMKLILSTTRAIDSVEEMNELTKRYDWVVLNYARNKDSALIEALEDKARIEIMANEFCVPGCPHRHEHYLHNSEDQISGTMRPFPCRANRPEFFDHKPGHPVMFTDDEVRHFHDEYGIENWKIVGRGVAFKAVLEAYVYYLIRSEYRDDVKRLVMQAAG